MKLPKLHLWQRTLSLYRGFWRWIGKQIRSAESHTIRQKDSQIIRLREELKELQYRQRAMKDTEKQLKLEIELLLMEKEVL